MAMRERIRFQKLYVDLNVYISLFSLTYIHTNTCRYAKKMVWEPFFVELLNIESCDKIPDLAKLRNIMEETLPQMPQVQAKFRSFDNILNKR